MIDIEKLTNEFAKKLVADIRENLESTGTNASGRTSDSLEYEADGYGATIYGRKYFQSVEEGRPGGKVPKGFHHIIYQWMQDKGISDKFGDTIQKQKSAAWMIARSIEKIGTRLYQDGGRVDIYTEPIDEGVKTLAEKIHVEINTTIANMMQNR